MLTAYLVSLFTIVATVLLHRGIPLVGTVSIGNKITIIHGRDDDRPSTYKSDPEDTLN